MALLTETNAQYYSGQQSFIGTGGFGPFTCDFNTDLVLTVVGVSNTNFSITVDNVAWIQGTDYSMALNKITFLNTGPQGAFPAIGSSIVVQLNETALWNNYGEYEYISLDNIVNNFLVAYVGDGKLITKAKRTDVLFHAKRGLQEFSYDTLKSIKSQELTIPPSLSIIIPQDYVNYVKMSWIDNLGVKHIIYPTTLTSNPYSVPEQDASGVPIQDQLEQNIETLSLTNERWDQASQDQLSGDRWWNNTGVWNWNWWKLAYGKRYGLNPSTSQSNGWFTIDEREGKFSFSSDLAGRLIILEYISDGLASDGDTKVPKMAEEAMYMHILHAILSTRAGIQEYVVRRFKKDRSATLRNAKIRLSNIKIEEITQVMRGKSKWIKH